MDEQSAQVAKRWTDLGSTDPMWAALTEPDKAGRWAPEDFLATGRQEIEAVLDLLERRGVAPRRGVALDFGCGPGRLTAGLAAAGFEHVYGLDVSPTMLETARRIVPAELSDRCEFVLNEGLTLASVPSGSCDLVYSCRVLQHMPPAMSHGYVREFLRVAAEGAVVVFQIPAEPARGVVGSALRVLPAPVTNRLRKGMEMHGTPPDVVTRLVAEAGGVTVSIEEDSSAGPRWRSHLYVVQRRSGATQ